MSTTNKVLFAAFVLVQKKLYTGITRCSHLRWWVLLWSPSCLVTLRESHFLMAPLKLLN